MSLLAEFHNAPAHRVPRVTSRLMLPSGIKAWVIVVYEEEQHFGQQNVSEMLQGLRQCAKDIGACPNFTT